MVVRRTGVDGKLERVGQGEACPREAERGAAAEIGGAQTAGSRRATLPRTKRNDEDASMSSDRVITTGLLILKM